MRMQKVSRKAVEQLRPMSASLALQAQQVASFCKCFAGCIHLYDRGVTVRHQRHHSPASAPELKIAPFHRSFEKGATLRAVLGLA
jgi:hypothetical protein